MRRTRWAAAAVCLLALGADGTPRTEPLDVGLVEETGVRRLFLDVEARDAEGRPMTGLAREDFRIRLDYLWRDIDTVDDLCPCGEGQPSSPAEDPRLAQVRTRFLLYFDFAQLRPDGRVEALDRARRWVEGTRAPQDEVLVVAHATKTGLVELCPFSTDRATILGAIERAALDPDLVDPFPGKLAERIEQCRSGTLACANVARGDYRQMQRSLRAILSFLTRMSDVSGRKALLLFHQNMTLFPGRMYPDRSNAYVPDVVDLAGEVAAAATSARTSVHVLRNGPGDEWTANFGTNLADGTGGSSSDGGDGTASVLAAAGRGCPCFYRIGVEPPADDSRVYRTKVKVRGKALRSRYHAHFLTGLDRWARKATAVLTNPEDAWGLTAKARLEPLPGDEGRCRLEAQVALELEVLAAAAAGGGFEWEVGALLAETGSGRSWEMLGLARLALEPGKDANPRVIHARIFENLPPGNYELRAYVHDRASGAYGGARAEIELGEWCLAPPAPKSTATLRLGSLPLRGDRDSIELVVFEPEKAAAPDF